MRPQAGVCEPLRPDVVVPKAHENNCSYVSSADLPSNSLRKNLAWWSVTQRTLKSHIMSKLVGGYLCRYGCLPRTILYVVGCN